MRVKSQKLLFPILAIITVTAAVMLSIFLLNAEEKTPTASEVTKKSLLFVYEGENAELKPVGDSGTEFTLSVPIASKESKVTWFTDRPNRDAGHMSYENFVKLFYSKTNDNFEVDPPNVAIQIGGTTLIAEMTKPEIVSGANNAESIIANFTLVSGSAQEEIDNEKSFISSHVSRSNEVKSIGSARTLERVSVFVDDMVMVTLNNVTSLPMTNAYLTAIPDTEPLKYFYNGLPFDLPTGTEIIESAACQVLIEGKLLSHVSIDMVNLPEELGIRNVGIAILKSAIPSILPLFYTYTVSYQLHCPELQVMENN
jgi:hypothetical protein